ncbi:glutathione S-transferase [Novosphingobium sp. SG751A]|uniref:glutathione S-transferase family protein n=1 Tax=Novosphingobium sp. SG751A TaxID=2587000 RepID=UPI00155647DC|nr:glutathione S-transferase [Novosphingobium sp. SG751A]NOW48056.1 glutathione S-transferase [Novosphingobium sp. SG751A]
MKLHWSPKSPYVRKVMIAAHELGIEGHIELVRSVAAMHRANPAIMADNPLNKIPTLVLDDGTAIFDSGVICEYFDLTFGKGRLFPQDAKARIEALTLHALANGLLDLAILLRNEREKPEGKRTAAWLDAFSCKIAAALDRLEAQVSTLQQAPFGIGHIGLGCALGYLDFRFEDLGWRHGRAGLTGWFHEFSKRPSARATEVIDG